LKFEIVVRSYRYGFNGKEKDDEVSGNGNSYDYGFRIYDARLGRCLSTDPKYKKYPDISPYTFAENNPILFIDPDGEEVVIHGADANATVAALQKTTALKLSIDANGKLAGELPQTPSTFSKLDIALLSEIRDDKVQVNLFATDATQVSVDANTVEVDVGGFGGNREFSTPEGETIVRAQQFFNIEQANAKSQDGGNSNGTNAAHEIVASYIAGEESPNAKIPVNENPTQGNGDAYLNAHKKASNIDPKFKEKKMVKVEQNMKKWIMRLNKKNVLFVFITIILSINVYSQDICKTKYLVSDIDTSSLYYFNIIKILAVDNDTIVLNLLSKKTKAIEKLYSKRIVIGNIYKFSLNPMFSIVDKRNGKDSVWISPALMRVVTINNETFFSTDYTITPYSTDNLLGLYYMKE
jgi:RHS repeat-associated protein